MRRLQLAVLLFACAFATGAAAEYPERPIHLIVPAGRRQRHRHGRAHSRRRFGRADRPTNHRRRPARRRAHRRARPHREGGAGRLHAVHGADRRAGDHAPPGGQPALCHRARFPADRGRSAEGHLLLAVSPTVPFQTVTELVAYAKQNPGKLSNASSSNGSPGHVGGELFKFMTGTEIVHVPYKGGAPAINDLIAGRVQLMFESLNSIAPFARSGAVRALAVSGDRRSPAFPDLPTIAEAGVPGYSAPTWSGVIAPAGVPRPIVDKLNAAINKAIQSRGFQGALRLDRRRAGRRHAGGIRRTDRVGFGEVGRSDPARRHQVRVVARAADALSSPPDSTHIGAMAKRPDRAIRRSIRRRTRPSRPAPRRRGRTCRRSTRRSPNLLNPAIGHGRAGVGSQTGSSPSPRRGGRGGGSGGKSQGRRAEQSSICASPPDPHPYPLPTRGRGRASVRACSHRRTIRSTAAPISANAHRARKSTQGKRRGFGERPQSGYVAQRARPAIDPELAEALGYGDSDPTRPLIGEPPDERDELADIFQSQREKRQRPTPQPMTLGVTASMQALDSLLREGRAEFRDSDGATKSGRRTGRRGRTNPKAGGARHQVGFRSQGRPADGDRRPGRRRAAQRPHPGAARRHRLGQDLHHGQGDRGDAAPGADPGAEQDAGGAALRRVQERSFPTTPSSISSSYYDYYQPEAYIPRTDTYIEKDSSINEQIDRMRHSATRALLERDDVIIVASVSCIYGIGSVETYSAMTFSIKRGDAAQPAPAARRPGGAAIQAHRRRFLSRLVPRARRRHRDFPGALRGSRLAGVAVRRRGGSDPRIRSAHRAKDRRAGIRQDLRQLALRDAAADAVAGDLRHQARIARAARTSSTPPGGCSKRSGSSSARCTIWK